MSVLSSCVVFLQTLLEFVEEAHVRSECRVGEWRVTNAVSRRVT